VPFAAASRSRSANLSSPPAALHRFTTSAVSYKKKKYPPQTQGPTPDPLEDFPEEDEEGDVTIESLVRDVRDLWGNNLPIGLLNKEEYAVYERYYGAPIRMLSEEDIEEMRKKVEDQLMGEPDEEVGTVTLEDAEGVEIEAVEEGEEFVEQQEGFEVEEEEFDGEEEEGEREFIGETTPGNFQARNEKEAAMYRKIASDLEKVLSVSSNAEELAPPELPEEEEEWFSRTHPLTQLGRFATHPSTIQLPESVKESTERILSEVANKHLDEAAMDILGGAQLTKSPIMAGKVKNYNSIPLDTTASMSDMEANVHIAAILPGYYAQTLSALSELRKRLGSDWVLGHKDTNEGGIKNVLDIGTGGAGIFALRDIIRAETELRNEERAVNQDEPPVEIPETEEHGPINDLRSVVVVGSNSLRFRMSKMLEHTTFVPRLPSDLGGVQLSFGGSSKPARRQCLPIFVETVSTLSFHPVTPTLELRQSAGRLGSVGRLNLGKICIASSTPHITSPPGKTFRYRQYRYLTTQSTRTLPKRPKSSAPEFPSSMAIITIALVILQDG
jgi:hypothetical protein